MTAMAAWILNKLRKQEQEMADAVSSPIAWHPVLDTFHGCYVTMACAGPIHRWEGPSGERGIQIGVGECMSKEDEEWLYGNKNVSGRKLVSLDHWNAEQQAKHDGEHNPACNGIACPNCTRTVELLDTNPNETLTTNPPQKRIHCPECGWTGLRIA